MKEAYFKDVVGIGDLYYLRSYYKIGCDDCVFTCKDAQNHLYMCLLVGLGNGVADWSIFRTTNQLLDEYILRRVSPWYMANMGDGWVYDITEDANGVYHSVQATVQSSMLSTSRVAGLLRP